MKNIEIIKYDKHSASHQQMYDELIKSLRPLSEGPEWLFEDLPSYLDVYLAIDRGRSVAGVWFRSLDDIYEVDYITTVPEYRAQGVAKKLMTVLVAQAVSGKVEEIWLEVEKRNAAAVKFYESVGFKQTSIRPDYYGLGRDALNFSLSLPSHG